MNRRQLLKRAGAWILGAGLFYPLYSFVVRKQVRPPHEVRLRKLLKPGEFLVEPSFTLFHTEEGPVAVSRTCTHLGCRINYDDKEKIFVCPCHQSRFLWNGTCVSGPARKNLNKFSVRVIEGEGYLVQLPRKIL
ncbi:MAG TPA: Rieske (2Fe-2S) protein [Thermodesulfobacteriaceae bacterium]|nr:Rieske (2Fe-2S) protein [Thermodesulfobacteriaceae bacterium]